MIETAVVIGRFQVPVLHKGHKHLLTRALETGATRMIIMIGCTGNNPTDIDPLSYEDRVVMVSKWFEDKNVLPIIVKLKDQPFSDEEWSLSIDQLIQDHTDLFRPVAIIHGRDSIKEHYSGNYDLVEVPEIEGVSGEQYRKDIATPNERSKVEYQAGYRVGKILAQRDKPYSNMYPCIDAIIHRKNEGLPIQILLGKKHGEKEWRMPGGHVDITDKSLEVTVMREVQEECGMIEIGVPQYFCSCPADDRRYRRTRDSIYTTVFTVQYIYGNPTAGDDLGTVAWVSLNDIRDGKVPILDGHKQILEDYADGK